MNGEGPEGKATWMCTPKKGGIQGSASWRVLTLSSPQRGPLLQSPCDPAALSVAETYLWRAEASSHPCAHSKPGLSSVLGNQGDQGDQAALWLLDCRCASRSTTVSLGTPRRAWSSSASTQVSVAGAGVCVYDNIPRRRARFQGPARKGKMGQREESLEQRWRVELGRCGNASGVSWRASKTPPGFGGSMSRTVPLFLSTYKIPAVFCRRIQQKCPSRGVHLPWNKTTYSSAAH